MNTLTIRKQLDRLSRRRRQLAAALEQLHSQEKEQEAGTDWADQATFHSRTDFADRLGRWYLDEIGEIDKAVARIAARRYGFCLACHAPIERARLESAPEAEYCTGCQGVREGLSRVQ